MRGPRRAPILAFEAVNPGRAHRQGLRGAAAAPGSLRRPALGRAEARSFSGRPNASRALAEENPLPPPVVKDLGATGLRSFI